MVFASCFLGTCPLLQAVVIPMVHTIAPSIKSLFIVCVYCFRFFGIDEPQKTAMFICCLLSV